MAFRPGSVGDDSGVPPSRRVRERPTDHSSLAALRRGSSITCSKSQAGTLSRGSAGRWGFRVAGRGGGSGELGFVGGGHEDMPGRGGEGLVAEAVWTAPSSPTKPARSMAKTTGELVEDHFLPDWFEARCMNVE